MASYKAKLTEGHLVCPPWCASSVTASLHFRGPLGPRWCRIVRVPHRMVSSRLRLSFVGRSRRRVGE